MQNNLNPLFKELDILSKVRESENNWQKMDTLINKIMNVQIGTVEIKLILKYPDFIKNCILSLRSKLSISSTNFGKFILEKINSEDIQHTEFVDYFNFYDTIIVSSLKLTGKSSRIISEKGTELLVAASFLQNFFSHKKIKVNLKTNSKNLNKRVRLAVHTAICNYLKTFSEDDTFFEDIIKEGVKDAMLEVRTVCKNFINQNDCKFGDALPKKETSKKIDQKAVNFPFLRKPVRNVNLKPQKIENVESEQQKAEIVKDRTKGFNLDCLKDVPTISYQNSPSKKNKKPKNNKLENNKLKNNLKSFLEEESSKDLKTPTKSEDELFTPRTLNKFLQKYKNISVKSLEFGKRETISDFLQVEKKEPKKIFGEINDQNKEFGVKYDGIVEAKELEATSLIVEENKNYEEEVKENQEKTEMENQILIESLIEDEIKSQNKVEIRNLTEINEKQDEKKPENEIEPNLIEENKKLENLIEENKKLEEIILVKESETKNSEKSIVFDSKEISSTGEAIPLESLTSEGNSETCSILNGSVMNNSSNLSNDAYECIVFPAANGDKIAESNSEKFLLRTPKKFPSFNENSKKDNLKPFSDVFFSEQSVILEEEDLNNSLTSLSLDGNKESNKSFFSKFEEEVKDLSNEAKNFAEESGSNSGKEGQKLKEEGQKLKEEDQHIVEGSENDFSFVEEDVSVNKKTAVKKNY